MNRAVGEAKEKDADLKRLNDDQLIAIWTKAVETQMHFNEMSVKSRQLGLTFVAAALGVAGVLIGQGRDFSMSLLLGDWAIHVHVAVLLILAALLAVLAVRRLDLGVYHRMLRGAVTFGEDLENVWLKERLDVEKGMTQSISHFSRHEDACVTPLDYGGYQYGGRDHKSAEDKIKGFYAYVLGFLAVSAISLMLLTNFGEPTPNAGSEIRDENPTTDY